MRLCRNYSIRRAVGLLVAPLLLVSGYAQQPWQQLSHPTLAEATKDFASPPPEYGPNVYYELTGVSAADAQKTLAVDLDRIRALGFGAITFQAGRNSVPYLSPEYFELVKQLVHEAKSRNLRVWIVDDGGYPSGFAGGRISAEAPELRMQALAVANTIDLTPGQEFEDVVSPSFVSAVAYNRDTHESIPLPATAAHIRFTPKSGRWQVLIVEHQFHTSLTRSITNPTGAKDESQSLEDYLNPAATQRFLSLTHERYKAAIGEEFGHTVLGFRGDEPDYSINGLPWTPAFFATFQQLKHYDIQPLAASLLMPTLSDEQMRLRADYRDVVATMFRDSFFSPQAAWCATNHLEYQVHINHEDDLPRLAVTEGDFFRDMRGVQLPGVDAIWHQIWTDAKPDFPKLASSAAHLGGHPRSFTESFAAYRPTPNLEQAKFITHEQFVRGINLLEVMHYSPRRIPAFMAEPGFPTFAQAIRRAGWLLSQGTPDASLAVYVPSRALWMDDYSANAATLTVAHSLLAMQRDFDFIDDDSLRSRVTLDGEALRTLSGSRILTVLVPDTSLMTVEALQMLSKLQQAGGHVIFFGAAPKEAVENTMKSLVPAPVVSDAIVAPLPGAKGFTAIVMATLPQAELSVASPTPELRYLHRSLADAQMYYLFNEGATPIDTSLQLRGINKAVQQWDAESGAMRSVQATPTANGVRLHLTLPSHSARILVGQ